MWAQVPRDASSSPSWAIQVPVTSPQSEVSRKRRRKRQLARGVASVAPPSDQVRRVGTRVDRK